MKKEELYIGYQYVNGFNKGIYTYKGIVTAYFERGYDLYLFQPYGYQTYVAYSATFVEKYFRQA